LINTVYVIAGPTATGKSDLSISLAKKLNGVVINSDSMQVYKNLEILTARPSSNDMKNIDHHLFGFVDGNERYNVERWCNDATQVIKKTTANNLTPILVGGTGLYINTLINGLIDLPSIPESFKIESEKILQKFGKDFLINQIKNIDPDSLKDINLNDTVRLRRIWEVFETTGKKFSAWKLNKNKKFITNYKFKILLFLPDRKKNYQVVNSRFVKMMKNGAVSEVKKFVRLKVPKDKTANKAIGIREVKEYLNKKIDIEEVIEKISIKTRQYAKRQMTWARGHMSNWKKLNPNRLNNFLKKI